MFASNALCACVSVRVCATLQLATNRITKPTKKQATHTGTHTLTRSATLHAYLDTNGSSDSASRAGTVGRRGRGRLGKMGIFRKIHLTIS